MLARLHACMLACLHAHVTNVCASLHAYMITCLHAFFSHEGGPGALCVSPCGCNNTNETHNYVAIALQGKDIDMQMAFDKHKALERSNGSRQCSTSMGTRARPPPTHTHTHTQCLMTLPRSRDSPPRGTSAQAMLRYVVLRKGS